MNSSTDDKNNEDNGIRVFGIDIEGMEGIDQGSDEYQAAVSKYCIEMAEKIDPVLALWGKVPVDEYIRRLEEVGLTLPPCGDIFSNCKSCLCGNPNLTYNPHPVSRTWPELEEEINFKG